MVMEPLVRLFKQFGCGMQVYLGTGNSGMAKIRRKHRKLGRQIGAFPVPREESPDCKCVTKIVNSGSWFSRRASKTNIPKKLYKYLGYPFLPIGAPSGANEHACFGRGGKPGSLPLM